MLYRFAEIFQAARLLMRHPIFSSIFLKLYIFPSGNNSPRWNESGFSVQISPLRAIIGRGDSISIHALGRRIIAETLKQKQLGLLPRSNPGLRGL